MTILVLFIKVTILLLAALACMPLMRRSTAALRHLVCAMALGGAVLFPLTPAFAPKAIPVHVPAAFIIRATTVAGATSQSFPLASTLLALWCLGALAFLLRLGLGYLRIALVLRTAERTSGPGPVYLADVSAPLICGLFNASILLPRSSESWPEDQRSAALRHEMAHMERRDLWTGLLANVACAVWWFHPLAWAVASRLRTEQEAACDDAVLSAGFEPATYAEALVAAATQLTSTSLIGCHMLNRQTLKSRIARLLDMSLPRRSSTAAMSRAGVAFVALLAVIAFIYAEAPKAVAAPQPVAATATAEAQPAAEAPPVAQTPQAAPEAAPVAEAQQAPQGAEEKVYKMGEGITPPRVQSKIDPKYTDEARDAKIEGSVLLSIVVGADGMAHQINVVSTPDEGLGLKAVEAVQQWKFSPAMKDGEPVAVKAQIEVNFKLM